MEKIFKDIEEKGFGVVKNFFDKKELLIFEKLIFDFSIQQVKKITKRKFKNINELSIFLFNNNLEILRETVEATPYLMGSKVFLANSKIIKLLKKIFGKYEKIYTTGPHIFYKNNIIKTRVYKPHTEQSYYPLRKSFFNLWFPLFFEKNKYNGSMTVFEGSHKIKSRIKKSRTVDNYYTKGFEQLEVVNSSLKNLKKTILEIPVGDLVVFHKDLVHLANTNSTKIISCHGEIRVYDYKKDQTYFRLPITRKKII
jgi:ectoine hydroxylase-related dioxygenase (phytanoyl-CoA dioxygenase family)